MVVVRAVLIVLSVGVIAVGTYVIEQHYVERAGADTHGPQGSAAEESPAHAVSAEEYSWAYVTNQVAADKAYKGQSLEVAGTVRVVIKDDAGVPHVWLNSAYAQLVVDAVFRDDAGLALLVPGQRVVMRCLGDAIENDRPTLRGCHLVGSACHVPNAEGRGPVDGVCLGTGVCSAPAVYYQGFCPGAADVVCCVR